MQTKATRNASSLIRSCAAFRNIHFLLQDRSYHSVVDRRFKKSSDMLPGSEKAIEVSPMNNRWVCNSWDSYEYLLLKLVGKSKKIVEAIYSIFEVEVGMNIFFLSREWKVYGNHDVQIVNEKSTLLMERPHRPHCMKCHSGLCYSCSRPPVGSSHSAQLSWSVSAPKRVKIILIVFKILVEKVVNE